MPIARCSPSRWDPRLQIHLCVLLWGFTAILGKLISLGALPLVFWRMAIVAGCLALWPPVRRGVAGVPARQIAAAFGVGLLVTVHWLCFYGAIKLANASVAATCMGLAPVFLSIIEPLLFGRPFAPRELWLALAAIPGIALVVGGIPAAMQSGFWLGALAALLASVFAALNKRLSTEIPALALTAVEMGAGVVLLGALVPVWPLLGAHFELPGPADAGWLLVLALACTLFPFALSLVALRRLSVFSAQLAVNLEPVYAVVLAALLLGESRELGLAFYLGVAIILGSVFGGTLRQGTAKGRHG
ncbi:MAG: DMT family transporter [Rhodocyclaceae bacterium]|nr:DMT family transporter [Rhodocyclaceae bacterium]